MVTVTNNLFVSVSCVHLHQNFHHGHNMTSDLQVFDLPSNAVIAKPILTVDPSRYSCLPAVNTDGNVIMILVNPHVLQQLQDGRNGVRYSVIRPVHIVQLLQCPRHLEITGVIDCLFILVTWFLVIKPPHSGGFLSSLQNICRNVSTCLSLCLFHYNLQSLWTFWLLKLNTEYSYWKNMYGWVIGHHNIMFKLN